MNEFEIIDRFFKPLSDQKHGLGLSDDAALVKPKDGYEFVMTTDALVQDVHFIDTHNAASLANKAIGVNVSDVIAKGAVPKYYMLTLAYQPSDAFNEAWFERFAAGLQEMQDLYGLLLIGGDSVRTSGPLTISITMMGEVPVGKMVRRSTAQIGDIVYVSGTIGDSVIGLELYSHDKGDGYLGLSIAQAEYFLNRYDFPEPDLALVKLVSRYANAAMDISDGLIGDLEKMCLASGKAVNVQLPDIPIVSCLQSQTAMNIALLKRLVTGGDDYQVLMTVTRSKSEALEQAAQEKNIKLTAIGIITDSRAGFNYYDEAGKRIEFSYKSYTHMCRF